MYSLVVAVELPVVAAESPSPNPKGRTERRYAWRCRDPAFRCNDSAQKVGTGCAIDAGWCPYGLYRGAAYTLRSWCDRTIERSVALQRPTGASHTDVVVSHTVIPHIPVSHRCVELGRLL